MFNNVFSLCLISVISLGLVSSVSAAEEKQTSAAAKVHTLSLPGMELKGEEIEYKVQRDGKHDISLRGQSALKIDEIVITADSIQVTYSKNRRCGSRFERKRDHFQQRRQTAGECGGSEV